MSDLLTRRLGFALVGTGAIAGVQAQALSNIPRAQLVAVYNHTAEKARALGDAWGVPWTTDYDDLLDRSEVDVVSICTPSGARVELAEAAAHAGKHVICEKPLEVTTERVDRIIRACDEASVQLGVIFPARFAPASQAAYAAIMAGRLGQLTMASARVTWHRPAAYYNAVPWRGTFALDGGGALMNQSIHWIDLLQWIGGGVAAVCGYTARLTHPDIEAEDAGVAVVRFASGALGTIEGTTTAFPGLPARVAFHGDRGAIVLEEKRIVTWKLADGSAEEEERMLRIGLDNTASGASDPMAIGSEGHRIQLAEITDALLDGRAPAVDGREGRKSVAIIRAIYESARTRCEATVAG